MFNKKPYIIGETDFHHEGDVEFLKELTYDIASLGLNAVKFHVLLDIDSYMCPSHSLYTRLSKWLISQDDWDKLIDYALGLGLDIILHCEDIKSVLYARSKYDVRYLSIHSISLNDLKMLDCLTTDTRSLYIGIGGSTIEEIQFTLEYLMKRKEYGQIILMYGFQAFPTSYKSVNLSKALKLSALFSLPVGYADHTPYDDPDNEIISVAGIMSGINILEKHYTTKEGVPRIDYQSAVGKEKMERIKTLVSIMSELYGSGSLRMNEAETHYRQYKSALVAERLIKVGDTIRLENVAFKRAAGNLLGQLEYLNLIGKKAITDIDRNEILDSTKVQ